MMPLYDPHPWSKQRHEEAFREAQRRLLAKLGKGVSRNALRTGSCRLRLERHPELAEVVAP
jgi:hypothetical protein